MATSEVEAVISNVAELSDAVVYGVEVMFEDSFLWPRWTDVKGHRFQVQRDVRVWRL